MRKVANEKERIVADQQVGGLGGEGGVESWDHREPVRRWEDEALQSYSSRPDPARLGSGRYAETCSKKKKASELRCAKLGARRWPALFKAQNLIWGTWLMMKLGAGSFFLHQHEKKVSGLHVKFGAEEKKTCHRKASVGCRAIGYVVITIQGRSTS